MKMQTTHTFSQRHIGPDAEETLQMLKTLGLSSLDELVEKVVPRSISDQAFNLEAGISEEDALAEMRGFALKNVLKKSLIGQGYYGCYTPQVILRNVLENPAWYTSYTPYQPEISQGRLEVLFNFQTMITELTGLDIANASVLDEATAAAEAMSMCHRVLRAKRNRFLVAKNTLPQTLDVIQTRAQALNIVVELVDFSEDTVNYSDAMAVLVQYPGVDGKVFDFSSVAEQAHASGALVICACDLLALNLLKSPANLGADVAIGNTQRFGVPFGFGGPHAAFMATRDKFKRNLPGRLIGLSIDASGQPAYRLALQTREQHIRREKATSNICTAQALLAVMATLYASYHGRDGLRSIALRVNSHAVTFSKQLAKLGFSITEKPFFDTLTFKIDAKAAELADKLSTAGYNLRLIDDSILGISFDETSCIDDTNKILTIIADFIGKSYEAIDQASLGSTISDELLRTDLYLSQDCFNSYHSETEMMRYIRRMSDKDLALDRAMIPLGSCTMKLNAAAEMAPVTWPEFTDIHPFVPEDQSRGFSEMIQQLETMLCACTGYDAVSVQPNAGSQGEYAGLLAIKRYHESRGEGDRNICLIPSSAHGTNPASADMAGLKVVVVACDENGNVDVIDLQNKIQAHRDKLSSIMITYPSTHGVFETQVGDICQQVHEAGGQVYIDGANLNAMVGLAKPGKFGGDVSHLNLHKTFCIPHGGGGPGVGPIVVGSHLEPFLPGHRCMGDATGVVSAAPWGSALILPITWMYIRMMGAKGLKRATQMAILNANYIAKRLSSKYKTLYTGRHGFVAHECILDTRILKDEAGITVDDLAKRLVDYGFHAPTMSFPVPGTLMVEPTESESKQEIDRFCDAMLSIHEEAMKVKSGVWPADDNPLCNAPHTAEVLICDDWTHAYSRKLAAYPVALDPQRFSKYWPPVGRVDNVHGDKNLICSCPPLSNYEDS
jgi:glycine dehydrogenase